MKNEYHRSQIPIDPLRESYLDVRLQSEWLCRPLLTEDFVVQTMPDVSPPKWHLAHVSWFFETFLLIPYLKNYRPFNPQYHDLFNSYYQSIGEPFPRARRGLLSRPSVTEVHRYRAAVDEGMVALIESLGSHRDSRTIGNLLEIGLHHEQQHQELLLTDIKHILGSNPLYPVYHDAAVAHLPDQAKPLSWTQLSGGEVTVGYSGGGFCFDNELPRHRALIDDFSLANRLVTNAEYLQFIDDGGYENPLLWLADGWAMARQQNWHAPLYWHLSDSGWQVFSLSGLNPLVLAEPVCHVSYYEADAYATWSGKRLPSEIEWEHAAETTDFSVGNYLDAGRFHPVPAPSGRLIEQLGGDVWEWTQSPYTAYPGYRAPVGAIGEYNGKFMCNQMVLRGGSCATPANHIRRTYRNFFYAHQRWQFMGIRLAQDAR